MATNKFFASYDEIIDVNTEKDTTSLLAFHTPTAEAPKQMLGPAFKLYKKYKYLGCDFQMAPAARMPVDPLGISYDEQTDQMDPRDIFNPILVKGCHGEDLGGILSRLVYGETLQGSTPGMDIIQIDNSHLTNYPELDSQIGILRNPLDALYYRSLTDRSWGKVDPSRGFSKHGLHPLVYKVASTMPLDPYMTESGAVNYPLGAPSYTGDVPNAITLAGYPNMDGSRKVTPKFLTPQLTGLGWMDTSTNLGVPTPDLTELIESFSQDDYASGVAQSSIMNAISTQNIPVVPKIFMFLMLLPPAMKTKQYYRIVVSHHFEFADFRGCSMAGEYLPREFLQSGTNAYYNTDVEISYDEALYNGEIVTPADVSALQIRLRCTDDEVEGPTSYLTDGACTGEGVTTIVNLGTVQIQSIFRTTTSCQPDEHTVLYWSASGTLSFDFEGERYTRDLAAIVYQAEETVDDDRINCGMYPQPTISGSGNSSIMASTGYVTFVFADGTNARIQLTAIVEGSSA